jgi:hypothetical protein
LIASLPFSVTTYAVTVFDQITIGEGDGRLSIAADHAEPRPDHGSISCALTP